jgi:hypothetical protein
MDMALMLANLIIPQHGDTNGARRSRYNKLFCRHLMEPFDHKAAPRKASGRLKGVSE